MLNEREQAAHDPTIAETAQGLSLAFEKLKAHFRTEYEGGAFWDWSLKNPYDS